MTSAEARKKTQKKYDQSEKGKAKKKRYNQSEKGKARKKRYNQSEKGKARNKKFREGKKGPASKRFQVLQYYSKRLSNSDIPCCNCCGENSHIDFLAIDHITGRKQMESDFVLKLLGYSSELKGPTLDHWIIKNNFPSGFQTLCHNCNVAKGMPKNKQVCPLAGKHQQ